jgi:3-oxoacyl-[acyl-carrier protein] reductase
MTSSSRRIALVTGGTRGIGFGIARALAGDGWDLALCGLRSEAAVTGAIETLRQSGAAVLYTATDLAVAADRARLIAAVRGRFGVVNALVNNAGRGSRVRLDLLDAQEDDFEALLRVNLQAPYFLAQAVARDQVERRRADPAFDASIVFVTSVSAEMVSVNRGDYCVSKAGLSMAARLFAVRLADAGIAVYEVRPGIVDTDMTRPVHDAYDRRIAEGLVPARRWGTPEDVGRIVAALLREPASYATGTVIHVDGGLSIPRL